jgi:hypothetical protein
MQPIAALSRVGGAAQGKVRINEPCYGGQVLFLIYPHFAADAPPFYFSRHAEGPLPPVIPAPEPAIVLLFHARNDVLARPGITPENLGPHPPLGPFCDRRQGHQDRLDIAARL